MTHNVIMQYVHGRIAWLQKKQQYAHAVLLIKSVLGSLYTTIEVYFGLEGATVLIVVCEKKLNYSNRLF